MQPIAVAGAHLKVYINSCLYGTVTGMAFRIVSGHEARRGIDNPMPFALVPTTYSVQGSLSVLRIRDGGLEGRGFVPFGNELPRQKYLSIQIIDRVTGRMLFNAANSVVNDQQWSVQSKSLMSGSFSFEAMGFGNESSDQ